MIFPFIKYRRIYFIISGILVLASLVFLIVFGLELGIDFTGGSILEIEYKDSRPPNREIEESLADLDLGQIQIQSSEERGIILRMKDIPEEAHRQILEKLREDKEFEELRFESIGPVIGAELKDKTRTMAILSVLAILIYVTFVFRKVSRPVVSWKYAIASIFALGHDILIPLGVFAVLGEFYSVQVTVPVVTAFLVVLGYSINDTVVVFDRIRENLAKGRNLTFAETVDQALNQTLTRSINTSLTTLFVLFAIFFLGGVTLKYFSLVLILGFICGTYSSIFLAGPFLVWWQKR